MGSAAAAAMVEEGLVVAEGVEGSVAAGWAAGAMAAAGWVVVAMVEGSAEED